MFALYNKKVQLQAHNGNEKSQHQKRLKKKRHEELKGFKNKALKIMKLKRESGYYRKELEEREKPFEEGSEMAWCRSWVQ